MTRGHDTWDLDDPVAPEGTDRDERLVHIWRLIATGRTDQARLQLMRLWSVSVDGFSTLQEGRVALRLFGRLGFTTDAPDEWATLPDPLTVYRAGAEPGVNWTADREVAEHHLRDMGDDANLLTGTVEKADALAYITWYGESEVIVRPEPVSVRAAG